uniref:Uncharacterized protein n=1 Tax=Dicentrarchus labrax TaxID=13489 RepID=A0A8P4KQA5_DICLA
VVSPAVFLGISSSVANFGVPWCSIYGCSRDGSGTMGFNEFKELSGTVEGPEMQQAITTMGYDLSPQAMNVIMNRYSTSGRIAFNDFVSSCVKLPQNHFRRRDTNQSGTAMFQYDDVSVHHLKKFLIFFIDMYFESRQYSISLLTNISGS